MNKLKETFRSLIKQHGIDKVRESVKRLSVNEAYGDLNDSGFKKVEKYNGIAIKLVKKLENAVRHSEGKDAVKWIKGLYDATGIMYDTIGHKMYYESVNEAIGSGATPEQIHKNLSMALKGAGFKVKKFEKMKWGFGGIWGGFYTVADGMVLPFHVKKDGKVSYDAGPRDWIIGNIDYPDVLKRELQKIKKMDGYGQDTIKKVSESFRDKLDTYGAALSALDVYANSLEEVPAPKKAKKVQGLMKKLHSLFLAKDESIKEAEASLPGNVKRFMEKFVDALDNTGLNRKRKVAVLAGIIDALDIEPQKLISMVNKIKSGIGVEGTIKEGVNKRLGWMDELIDQLGSEEKVLEEVFRALSDKEAKEVYDWIMRHWR